MLLVIILLGWRSLAPRKDEVILGLADAQGTGLLMVSDLKVARCMYREYGGCGGEWGGK